LPVSIISEAQGANNVGDKIADTESGIYRVDPTSEQCGVAAWSRDRAVWSSHGERSIQSRAHSETFECNVEQKTTQGRVERRGF
jgi:hypothetical protein